MRSANVRCSWIPVMAIGASDLDAIAPMHVAYVRVTMDATFALDRRIFIGLAHEIDES